MITNLQSSTNEALDRLEAHGVKPSMQRLAVMQYLIDHRTHPAADEIYLALHPAMPTLSKTTVYNTLRLLTEKGAALQLAIDERNSCFDADTAPHAHFLCKGCGRVFDVPLANKCLVGNALLPDGFQTDEAQLYFKGLCPTCAENAH